ncbi:MAG: methylated-DNA--[protein]-cysteine S-methyltransferase [Bacteroidales bacterium]
MMREVVYYQSPVGVLAIGIEKNVLASIEFTEKATQNSATVSETARQTVMQLQEYFESKRTDFNLPLTTKGTEFQQKVWKELERIPYGESISYHELARRVGNEKAYRAVGNANGKNPICIIIPCHRVIQANGNIGGYAYGSEVKQFLLELEKQKK